jgi:hypothetical protein
MLIIPHLSITDLRLVSDGESSQTRAFFNPRRVNGSPRNNRPVIEGRVFRPGSLAGAEHPGKRCL